jgi:hypothetical protein
MKVSVVEALRIQKEIAQAVQQAMCHERGCKYGVSLEEGVVLDQGNAKAFPEFITNLLNLFDISQKINSILADFSVKNKVSDMVRERENLKVLLRIYENGLQMFPSASTTRFEIVGTQKTKVTRTFEPYVTKKAMKEKVKELKASIRDTQAKIDVANAQIIDLPFEFADFEMLDEKED